MLTIRGVEGLGDLDLLVLPVALDILLCRLWQLSCLLISLACDTGEPGECDRAEHGERERGECEWEWGEEIGDSGPEQWYGDRWIPIVPEPRKFMFKRELSYFIRFKKGHDQKEVSHRTIDRIIFPLISSSICIYAEFCVFSLSLRELYKISRNFR